MKLYFLPASASARVLVIRRGPSKWWHFLLWNRDTGEVLPGSWFNGMIYPHRCDLSPKGDWMTVLAYRGTNKPPAWTVLAKPPSVTAAVFWAQESCKIGGGYFDERLPVLWMNIPRKLAFADQREDHLYEYGFPERPDHYYGNAIDRLKRDGWKECKGKIPEGMSRWKKQSPKKNYILYREFTATTEDLKGEPRCLFSINSRYYIAPLRDTQQTALNEECCWANWNSRGELCFCEEGVLWTAEPSNIDGTRRAVMDLASLQPRERVSRATPLPIAAIDP